MHILHRVLFDKMENKEGIQQGGIDSMRSILMIDASQQSIEELKRRIDWAYYGFIIRDAAFTTADGLTFINTNSYDLYLINLKDLDQQYGFELCQQIRERTPNPILLIEGDKDFDSIQKAMRLKVSNYLPKPLNTEELIESLLAIKEALETKKTNASTNHTKKPVLMPQNDANIIDVVKDYVEQSIHENITLKEISDNLHYNSSYLGQKFKSQEKMSFNQYLLNRRMEKTKFLLRYTDLKIYEIAYQVGYTDLDWFYKKFKEHTGVSASVYRYQSNESVNIKKVQ